MPQVWTSGMQVKCRTVGVILMAQFPAAECRRPVAGGRVGQGHTTAIPGGLSSLEVCELSSIKVLDGNSHTLEKDRIGNAFGLFCFKQAASLVEIGKRI